MENIFDAATVQNYILRINQLTPTTERKWGEMSVDQMLAYCNVSYEMIYQPEKLRKPGGIAKWMLKNFVKKKVVNDIPYKANIPTAPQFIVEGDRDFEVEKKRLIGYLQKTQNLGEQAFDGKESFSFGKLSAHEWNNMLAKHLNHHLQQFGV